MPSDIYFPNECMLQDSFSQDILTNQDLVNTSDLVSLVDNIDVNSSYSAPKTKILQISPPPNSSENLPPPRPQSPSESVQHIENDQSNGYFHQLPPPTKYIETLVGCYPEVDEPIVMSYDSPPSSFSRRFHYGTHPAHKIDHVPMSDGIPKKPFVKTLIPRITRLKTINEGRTYV